MNNLALRICLIFLGLIPLAADGLAQSQSITTDENVTWVRTTALTSLDAFLNKIPQGRETEYGFRSRDEFGRADLGTPVRIFTLRPDSLTGEIDPGRNYLIPMDEWRVPIMVEGEFRSLLTVARVNNSLKTVELGGESLAREMMEFWKKDPNGQSGLLRLYTLRCDFLIFDRNGSGIEKGEYYPLHSARLVFKSLECNAARPCFRSDLFPGIQSKFAEEQRKE